MKLVKSLLLGSAAGFFAVAGAQAADLPAKKSAPVEFVRVCSAYGNGFFYIPGTETCLRVSGRVRAEYRYVETFSRADSAGGWRARGRLNLDARTQTAYGTLRTFIRYELTRNSGNYFNAANYPAQVNATVNLDKAFIQFAGVTAGRATSFFDFYANDLNWSALRNSDTIGSDPVLLAYTASFGGGVSATISFEETAARRNTSTVGSYLVGYTTAGVPLFADGYSYAGERMPEIVGALRFDQAWGSAQLSGAVRQLNSANYVPASALAVGSLRPLADTEYGFAVQGGVKINLPMIAAGDVLWLQAAYGDGASNYVFGTSGRNLTAGGLNAGIADAVVDPVTGNVKKVKTFSALAAFLHYWTPQVRQSVFGGYAQADVPGAVQALPVGSTFALPGGAGYYANTSLSDLKEFKVGTNLIWSPVRDLDIGVEVLYTRLDPKGRYIDSSKPVGTGVVYTKGSEDFWEGRVRIQRDF